MIDRLLQLVLDVAIGVAAERHHGTLARADDPGDDGNVVADHIVEIERGLGLVDQRRDVADIHRLMQIDQFPILAEAIEELAEILLHQSLQEALAAGQLSRAKAGRQSAGLRTFLKLAGLKRSEPWRLSCKRG